MCAHCETLLRWLPQLRGNKPQVVELLSVALDAIRAAHKLPTLSRASRARWTIDDSLRRIESAGYTFYARPNAANYLVIIGCISAFWSSRMRAIDLTPARKLNKRGKSEPRAQPRVHRIPDCWIHDHESYDPARVAENVDYAQTALNRAKYRLTLAERVAHDHRNSDTRAFARERAAMLENKISQIRPALAEYRSAHER